MFDFYKFMSEEFQKGAAYYGDRSVRETYRDALAKWNALGEVDNAIENLFLHFPLPGGLRGRYHDTLCGKSLHWTHVVHVEEGNAEQEREAINGVTCPPCLELFMGNDGEK